MLDGAKNPRGSRMSCSIYRCNDVLRLEMAVLLVGFVDQLALPASSGTFFFRLLKLFAITWPNNCFVSSLQRL